MEFNTKQLEKNNITIAAPPNPKSTLRIGDIYYRTSLPVDQHFNWFQKLMWKLCFGVKVEDYSEE